MKNVQPRYRDTVLHPLAAWVCKKACFFMLLRYSFGVILRADAACFDHFPAPPFPGESNLHRTLTHYDIPFIPRRDWGVEARSLSPEVKVCNFSLSCEVGVTNPNGGVGGVKPEHRKRSWGQEQCPILGQMLPVLTTHNKGDALEPKLYLVRKQTCCDKEKPKNGCR